MTFFTWAMISSSGANQTLLGFQRVLQPLLHLPPAGQPAGEEGMPDADPEAARLILRVELFPEGLEAL